MESKPSGRSGGPGEPTKNCNEAATGAAGGPGSSKKDSELKQGESKKAAEAGMGALAQGLRMKKPSSFSKANPTKTPTS